MLGSVVAGNTEDAERRFFEAWLPTVPAGAASANAGSGHGGRGTGPSLLARLLGR